MEEIQEYLTIRTNEGYSVGKSLFFHDYKSNNWHMGLQFHHFLHFFQSLKEKNPLRFCFSQFQSVNVPNR